MMRRFATLLASLAIIGGLGACCCPCGGFPRGGGPPVNINVPPVVVNQPPQDGNVIKPDDPAVTAIKARGGSVKRDGGQPGEPVIEVDLGFKNLNDGDLRVLLSPFPQLRKLRLSQNPGITGVGFRDLANLQQLENLDLSFDPISDEGMKAIAAFRQLKVLNILGAKITDVGMREVAKLDQLQELGASGMLLNGVGKNEPTDIAIKELGRLKQLRKLDLSNTQVGDLAMAEFGKLDQLQELIAGHQVTDAGVNAVAGLNQLQVLALLNNHTVTVACIPTLKGLPALREFQVGLNHKSKAQFRKALEPRVKVK
jgi:Leucine Rich repeat